MSEKRVIDRERFVTRLEKFYKFWLDKLHESLSEVDAFSFMVGASDEEDVVQYSKSIALQTWLFGYEMADVLSIFTKKSVLFLCSARKATFLQPIVSDDQRGNIPPISCLVREKNDKDKEKLSTAIGILKKAADNPKIGYFAKDKYKSEFAVLWADTLKEEVLTEMSDVSIAMATLMAVKDETEINFLRKASLASVAVWNNFLKKKFVAIIDHEQKMKHMKLADETEMAMTDVKVIGSCGVQKEQIDTCYTPIIQSGGNYTLKLSSESDNKLVHFGAIVSTFGARYHSYCSNLARTIMVDPDESIEEAYEILLLAEDDLIKALKPGSKLCDVYEVAVNSVREKNPELVDYLIKGPFGFATGLEFREGAFTIGPKTTTTVEAGMVFVVFIGMNKLETKKAKDQEGKTMAVLLSDTVLIAQDGNEILTEKAKSRTRSNLIRFKEEVERKEDNKENQRKTPENLGRGKRTVIINDQTRKKETNEDKRKEKQKELAEQLNREARERFSSGTRKKDEAKSKKSNISYRTYEKFPKDQEISKLSIFVDRKHDTIILPIFGVPVPFHISMIKNSSQSVVGEFTYLRINFTHPGSQIGKDNNHYPNPLATYLKELTYRSSNLKEPGELNPASYNLMTAFRLIKEIQKKFRTQEAEEREREGAVKQDKLVLSGNKGNPRLKDLYVRPNIIAKRISGTLEAHLNGFRYTSLRGDKIDVLYNNIKHAFFQPCDSEMIILLHFNLKHPVLWGKKKYQDIQFYAEVGEITTDLGKYHHMQDRDDIASEQMERELRNKLNAAFKSFTEKVERQTNNAFDFDSPFRDLAFYGVPLRSSVFLKPTANCLINLTEWPPFVITLDDVELVHFERVSFSLKNFDMVFIFKDYTRKTQMIQQVPMPSLDSVKEWLNSCEIRYTEGIQSLNWTKIMKTIVDDPEGFFNEGGWNFLNQESDNEEQEDDSDESADAYTPSEESAEDEDEEEEEEDESDAEESSSESEEDASESNDSSGKDWSDLEEEARKADKEKELGEETVDRLGKHKRHSPMKGKGPSSKRRK